LYFDNIAFSGVQHSWRHPDMVVREIVDDVCTPKEEVAEQIIAPIVDAMPKEQLYQVIGLVLP
jgi:hypothetical protein